jgi:polysaccharide pyruvyl transferase WcaK-like protein
MRLVVPFGFYGWGNIGDESTLQGFARLIAMRSRTVAPIWVASRNPAHTARVEPAFRYYNAMRRDVRGWWARRRAAVYLFAGGTPIMDILGAYPLADVAPIVSTGYRRGKSIVFVGIGTERLHRPESKRIVADLLAPCVQYWSVRCDRDRDRLTSCGIPADRVTSAGDMAWLLDPVATSWGREFLRQLGVDVNGLLIGVNVNNEPFMQREAPQLLADVGRFLDGLISGHGATALFLCNDVSEGPTYEKAASLVIRSTMRHADRAILVPNRYWSPQQMLSLVGCCRVTLSSRYHFCLFSALQGVPFIALQRSDKVNDLCSDLEWRWGTSIATATPAVLHALYEDVVERQPVWRTGLAQGAARMRQRALKNHEALDRVIPPREGR